MAAARFIADGSHGEARAVSVLYTGAWDNVKMAPDHTAMSEECARQYELLVAAGIPIEGLPLLHALDRVFDMIRTVLNITGDAVTAAVTDRLAK